MSLTSKLQILRRKHNKHWMSKDQQRLIARWLPKDEASLRRWLTPEQWRLFGEDLLQITRSHYRDQARFEQCVRELRLFAAAGPYPLQLLTRVHKPILDHFGMAKEKWEVFDAAGIWVDFEKGTIMLRETD